MIYPNWTSSGHLRGCSEADTHIQSLSSDTYPSMISLPSILGHYKHLIASFTPLDTIWC